MAQYALLFGKPDNVMARQKSKTTSRDHTGIKSQTTPKQQHHISRLARKVFIIRLSMPCGPQTTLSCTIGIDRREPKKTQC
jgi:hypothetical protein